MCHESIIRYNETVKYLWNAYKIEYGIAGEIRWRKTTGSKRMYDSQLQQETEIMTDDIKASLS